MAERPGAQEQKQGKQVSGRAQGARMRRESELEAARSQVNPDGVSGPTLAYALSVCTAEQARLHCGDLAHR